MLRSCRNHFRCFSQMKITKMELFQNALKIIMVGIGNVLSPHKYFQFERTLKNVVVNSESAFWDILWKAIILGFVPRYFGMTWMDRKVVDPPKRAANFVGGLGGPPVWLPSTIWCSTYLPILPLCMTKSMGTLGICGGTLPLGFPINRR